MDTGPNAFRDIMDDPRFQGQIASIGKVTAFFDNFFIQFVTFIGFLIITLALFKNILAALYCANPKLFDMIAALKKDMASSKSNGNAGGWVLWLLSLVIPNIKAMTDFADDEDGIKYNLKTYVLKSFLTAFCSVMLGTMVYNGLYRDVLGKTSDVAAYFLSSKIIPVINKDNLNKLMMVGNDYEFGFGDSDAGKAMTKIAKDVYEAVKQYYGDVESAENKWALGQAIEDWLAGEFNSIPSTFEGTGTVADLMGSDEFKMQYKADVVVAQPSTELKARLDTAKEAEFILAKQVVDFGHKTTTFEADEDTSWVRLVLNFNRKEVRGSTGYKNVSVKGFMIKEGSSSTKYYLILPQGLSSPLKLGDTSWKIDNGNKLPNTPSVENYAVYTVTSGDASSISGTYESSQLSTSTRYKGKSGITSITIDSSGKSDSSSYGVALEGSSEYLSVIPDADLKVDMKDDGNKNNGTSTNNNSNSNNNSDNPNYLEAGDDDSL